MPLQCPHLRKIPVGLVFGYMIGFLTVCLCMKDFEETSLEHFYPHAGSESGDDGLMMFSREWETFILELSPLFLNMKC